jgi:hypothetical protein
VANAARLQVEVYETTDQVWAATRAASLAIQSMRAKMALGQTRDASGSPRGLPSRVERLEARLATQAVIEQAKGILMARQGCDPDQAFDALRRASQRTNRPVRELARDIIAANRVKPAGPDPPQPSALPATKGQLDRRVHEDGRDAHLGKPNPPCR